MKKMQNYALIALAVTISAGCATSGGKSAAEANPGKFVSYTCLDKKSFQARFNAEEGTVRIRTHEGSAELTKGNRGLYWDDEKKWILSLGDGQSTELVLNNKAIYKECSAS